MASLDGARLANIFEFKAGLLVLILHLFLGEITPFYRFLPMLNSPTLNIVSIGCFLSKLAPSILAR
jgi:hypothetical protein